MNPSQHVFANEPTNQGIRTRQDKQQEPVNNQHWPEHWNIEDFKPSAEEANGGCPCRTMPELELRKSSDKGAELLVIFSGQRRGATFLQLFLF